MKPFIYAAIVLYGASFVIVLAHHLKGPSWCEKVSKVLVTIGLLAHTAALGARIYSTGHAPMASMYETLVFYGWCTALVSVLVIYRYDERATELITIPLVILASVFALSFAQPGGPLTLILDTHWFELHVTASFAAYSLFTLAFSGAVFYLLNSARSAEEQLRKYQDIAARSVLWGFFFFSASMFSGAVWGYLAWGAYWMWEPKIIWSFIVWFYFAGAMHAYYVKDWKGKGLSVATIIGFFIVLFTYLGVSLLMKSSHSF